MNGLLFSFKRDFDYEQEEKAFMGFMKMIFIICALIFVWNAYSHFKQINLVENGTGVLASVYTYTGGERISFVAEDGKTYGNNISGMFLPEHDDTLMVYYIDNPATAMPLTADRFFYILYAVTIAGMGLSGWQLHRMKESMRKNQTPVEEEY